MTQETLPAKNTRTPSKALKAFSLFYRIVVRTALVVAFFLFIGVSIVLFTNSGNQMLWKLAVDNVDGLSGELVVGNIGDHWEFKNLRFQIPNTIDLSIDQLYLELELTSLLHGEAVIKKIATGNVLVVVGDKPENMPPLVKFIAERVDELKTWNADDNGNLYRTREAIPDTTATIAPIKTPTEDDDESSEGFDSFISLPIKAIIRQCSVDNFVLLMTDIDVVATNVSTSVQVVNDTAFVDHITADYVDVLLHDERMADTTASDNTPTEPVVTPSLPDPFDHDAIAKVVEHLPTVFIPIKIDVQLTSIKGVRYHQSTYDTGVMRTSLSAKMVGNELFVRNWTVSHELGQVVLTNSKLALHDYYPLEVNLRAHSINKEWFDLLHTHTATITGQGDLTDMRVHANFQGIMQGNIQARVGVLSPNLPFAINLEGKNLVYPVLQPEYTVNSLTLATKGDLTSISSILNAKDISLDNQPKFSISTKVKNNFSEADIAYLKLHSSTDHVELAGLINWEKGVSFAGNLKGNIDNFATYIKDIAGDANFAVGADVAFTDAEHWSAKLHKLDVRANYGTITHDPITHGTTAHMLPISLTAKKFKLNSSYIGEIADLKVANGVENSITINGNFQKNLNLNIDVDCAELGNLRTVLPNVHLEGALAGNIKVSGTKDDPATVINLHSDTLSYDDTIVEDLKLQANIATKKLFVTASDIKLTVATILQNHESLVKDLNLLFQGSQDKHQLTINSAVKKEPFKLHLAGSLNQKYTKYNATLDTLSYSYKSLPIALKTPLTAMIDLAKMRVDSTAHNWNILGNEVKVSEGFYDNNNAHLAVQMNKFALRKLRKFMPAGIRLRGNIDVAADLALQAGTPLADITLDSNDTVFYYHNEPLRFLNISFHSALQQKTAQTDLKIELEKGGKIQTALTVVEPTAKDPALTGNYKIEHLNLALFQPFAQAVSTMDGMLTGNGTFAGSFAKPMLYGDLSIDNASVTSTYELGKFENINTKLTFKGVTADLNSSFTVAEKKGKVTGMMSWYPDFNGQVAMVTDELPVNFLGYGEGRVAIDVKAIYDPNVSTVRGTVTVPYADIEVKTLPASSVATSSDVVVIRRDNTGNIQVMRQNNMPVDIALKIAIGPEVKVEAFGLKTSLKGNLAMRQLPRKNMTANGRIDLEDGRFKAYGQNLIIEKGRISFVGDIANPNIDIRAIRDPKSMHDDSVTAGVQITGNASHPNVQVFSTPQLSQTEALSYLLRGKGMDSTTSESDMSTQLLLGLGLMQTNAYVAELGSAVGLQDVAVDSKNEGDDTAVEVSAYIFPKLQVAYGYGIYNSLSEFRIRYELFPRFYIEALSAVEQAIDAVYKFEFDF